MIRRQPRHHYPLPHTTPLLPISEIPIKRERQPLGRPQEDLGLPMPATIEGLHRKRFARGKEIFCWDYILFNQRFVVDYLILLLSWDIISCPLKLWSRKPTRATACLEERKSVITLDSDFSTICSYIQHTSYSHSLLLFAGIQHRVLRCLLAPTVFLCGWILFVFTCHLTQSFDPNAIIQ
jgi:hypothetical protein